MLRSNFRYSEATTFLPTYVLVALQDYPIAYQKVQFAPLTPQASVCPRTILYSEDYSALLDIAVNYVATLFSPKLTYSCHIRNPLT